MFDALIPFLRWAGSKRQIVAKLQPYFPGSPARYIEPFAGSGCLFFALEPKSGTLGDLNSDLVATFRAVKADVGGVIQALDQIPIGKSAYYRVRSLKPALLPSAEAAARFVYLNRYCFNGIYRTNSAGEFNVPYGPPKSGAPVDRALLVRGSKALQSADLLNADFEETARLARRGDFVYLDPPYAVASRRIFVDYLPTAFGQRDLARLGQLLRVLNRRGVEFVATYADCPEARELFGEWRPKRIWTRRNIAGFVADRRGSYELLATNIRRRVP